MAVALFDASPFELEPPPPQPARIAAVAASGRIISRRVTVA
jgi:hypothetical protein